MTYCRKKLIIASFDDKTMHIAHLHGFRNVLKILPPVDAFNLTATQRFHYLRYRMLHTLLSNDINVLALSVDQVLLDNPLTGLRGDADIEIETNLPKLSFIFSEQSSAVPTQIDDHDIMDNVDPGLMYLSVGYQAFTLLQTLIMSAGTIFDHAKSMGNYKRRFNLYVLSMIKFPAKFCYEDGVFNEGIFTYPTSDTNKGISNNHNNCAELVRDGLRVRILPINKYLSGPNFLWEKVHCHVNGRDGDNLELNHQRGNDRNSKLPICGDRDEMKYVVVVHLSNVFRVSKAYYFRDRMLWFARDDAMRFDDRILVSTSRSDVMKRHLETSAVVSSEFAVVEEASVMLLQILLSVVLQGDLVLPKWPCKFIPNINTLFGLDNVWDIETTSEVTVESSMNHSATNSKKSGLCSLDHFIELTALNDVLFAAEVQQTNRTWNKIQQGEKDMQLSYIENEILNVHKRSKVNLYADKREDFTRKRLGWVDELWKSKLIILDFSFQKIERSLAVNVLMNMTLPGQSNPSISILVDEDKDRHKLDSAISSLRRRRNHHIQLRGLTSSMTSQLFDSLWRYIPYFKSAQYANAKLSAAFDCGPDQRYHQMFPQFFNDIKWEVQAARYHCGVKGFVP